MAPEHAIEEKHSVWEPLRVQAFRAFWIAAIFSNTGMFMQEVSSAWLMTSLSQSPMMIALMQTATTLPFFALALPAGALADLVNKRQLLICAQIWMLCAAATLGLLTLYGMTTPWLLLTLTFILGIGQAACAPAWNALTPELVPRKQLVNAIGLGSAGYNLARGAGAALGGVLVASAGPGWVFLLNACSFSFMIATLARWKPVRKDASAPAEKVIGAMRAGVRYVRHTKTMHAILARTIGFALGSSALWALIPLLAREKLKVNSVEYGIMVSAFGIGTLMGALMIPWVRRHMSLDRSSALGTVLFAIGLSSVAFSSHYLLCCIALVIAGTAWTIKCSALNYSAQLVAPQWVRARVLAIYLLVFQGSTAAGAILWGVLASQFGMQISMYVASIQLLTGLMSMAWYKLDQAELLNVKASGHWHDPEIHEDNPPANDEGPALVTVEYIIDPERYTEFREALRNLEIQRRRDGAYMWYVFRDVADQARYVEMFFVETWGEHMRQHERTLEGDQAAEQLVDSFHIGDDRPLSHHFVAAQIANVSRVLTGSHELVR
jgi:MFS family permease